MAIPHGWTSSVFAASIPAITAATGTSAWHSGAPTADARASFRATAAGMRNSPELVEIWASRPSKLENWPLTMHPPTSSLRKWWKNGRQNMMSSDGPQLLSHTLFSDWLRLLDERVWTMSKVENQQKTVYGVCAWSHWGPKTAIESYEKLLLSSPGASDKSLESLGVEL